MHRRGRAPPAKHVSPPATDGSSAAAPPPLQSTGGQHRADRAGGHARATLWQVRDRKKPIPCGCAGHLQPNRHSSRLLDPTKQSSTAGQPRLEGAHITRVLHVRRQRVQCASKPAKATKRSHRAERSPGLNCGSKIRKLSVKNSVCDRLHSSQPLPSTYKKQRTLPPNFQICQSSHNHKTTKMYSLTTNHSFNQQRPTRNHSRSSLHLLFKFYDPHNFRRSVRPKVVGICDTFVISEQCFWKPFSAARIWVKECPLG